MVSRNADSASFVLGVVAGVIGLVSLVLTCAGVGLPLWYVGTNADKTVAVAKANLFYSCYSQVTSQGTASSTFVCVSYGSYSCSTSSYQNIVLNGNVSMPGCTNPNAESSVYSIFDAPIYQASTKSFYNLRTAAILSTISVLFILSSTIVAFLTGIVSMNTYLVFVGPVFAAIAVVTGLSSLATVGSSFSPNGSGFALFVVGISLESVALVLLSAVAGRLNGVDVRRFHQEEESMFTDQDNAPAVLQ